MIKNLLLILLAGFSITANCQNDTSAYQLQRLKVNALLAQRSANFGQYDQSLNSRTGIFGLQTKKDIKNSNEILREIAINDNNIFKELKILMEYKDLQVQQVQTNASTSTDRIENYMLAIKKLQDQNQLLRQESKKSAARQGFAYAIISLLTLIWIGSIYFFYTKIKKLQLR